ncbi:tripartite tricarboxylate transporter TctB family protein [Natronosalvus rutilus]|uniref:Tripartite tricarboxylate transporter TctB family protein n=1 Tax=Natronosalvus rutilus TaxID=2953753 RepID=A0A9E7NBF0_9EURY|nr:tripartite tricarboxylate transporter TctB family protein [Natronosalvus rutilus]UTF54810.1 tripartite tricarboxylate transporter TctB family protein [Natronosalvus rutilus]
MTDIRTWFDSETIFLILVAAFAIWIYLGGDDYSSAGAMYPQLTAGIVLGLLALLVVLRLLPADIQDSVTSSTEAIDYGEISETQSFSTRNVGIVALLFAVYVIGVYAIGFLLATVPYVYGSLVAFGYGTQKRRVAITALITLMVVAGYILLGIPWTFGEVFEFLG